MEKSFSLPVFCYYASWATSRSGNGRITPEDIDANLCTHINYAFVGLNPDGTLEPLSKNNDIDQNGYYRISSLKKINPNLKVIFSIGGASADIAVFSRIAGDVDKRKIFVQSCLDYLKKYDFDGVDIDWEYPLKPDWDTYITLLKELKQAFKPFGYILTVAVAYYPGDAAYNVPVMSESLDYIHIMTYDFHSSWSGKTAENSPLYGSSTEGSWQRENLNANSSIINWILAGAAREKVVIGVAFYGHSFILNNNNNHDLGATSNGPAPPGPYTNNIGTLGYNEICEFHKNGVIVWNEEQQVPYLYDNKLWIGYDNDKSVGLKAKYAKDNGLGGIMIWSIETDDIHGVCGPKNILLKSINDNIK